jgi:rhamnogalacturonyl hydrolase YesR
MWLHTLTLSAIALTLTAHPHASHHEPPKYSIQMATSIISRHQGILSSPSDSSALLQAGFVQKAFHQLQQSLNHTSSHSIKSYIESSINSIIPVISNASKDTTFPLDRLSTGNSLIYAYQSTGNGSYKTAYEALYDSVGFQPRNLDGSYWYYVYPNYTYLDGMYSLAPFLGLLATATNFSQESGVIIDDVVRQLDLVWQHTYVNGSGLLVHGYDASKRAVWSNADTGASMYVWGRSLGWYLMGLVDALEVLSASGGDTAVEESKAVSAAHTWLIQHFQALTKAVIDAVDRETGAWWQVLDHPGRDGNYVESSGSAMFVYCLLKGVRMGYLNGTASEIGTGIGKTRGDDKGSNCEYEKVAKRAYEYLVDTFVVDNGNGTLGWNGTVGVCSLNSSATYEVCSLTSPYICSLES